MSQNVIMFVLAVGVASFAYCRGHRAAMLLPVCSVCTSAGWPLAVRHAACSGRSSPRWPA
jgi:hypothetical protein